jgi:outer membrane cobalamin receptor
MCRTSVLIMVCRSIRSPHSEVVRGPGTLRYGSQAIGGVINAINDRVPTRLNEGPVSGEVDGGFGSGSDSKLGYGPLKTLNIEGGYGDYNHKERNCNGAGIHAHQRFDRCVV